MAVPHLGDGRSAVLHAGRERIADRLALRGEGAGNVIDDAA
jgi:hypothetical protein